jgi:alcohol dehydrogenase, propanol-preferring
VQFAVAMGFRVLAIGTGKEKENLSKSLGAEEFIDYRIIPGAAEVEEVRRITGGGAHVFMVLSDHPIPYENAQKMVRTRGSIMCVALPSNVVVGNNVFDVVTRNLTIKGIYMYILFGWAEYSGTRADVAEVLDFLDRGKVKVVHTLYGLSELPKVYEMMTADAILGRIILDTSR